MNPYEILDDLRRGDAMSDEQILAAVEGSVSGQWSDAQLAAFLMAVAIRGLEPSQTAELIGAMMRSGEQWDLRAHFPGVVDKHSTGGVGDKVSLLVAPILAELGVPVAMLTGRSLGHTGGTADKLESIPGLHLDLDREGALRSLEATGVAIGVATAGIAPADRRLYALRDQTGTVASLPLVLASILSKKLAAGPAAIVFDVKTGDGAFFSEPADALELAEQLAQLSHSLDVPASSLVTDMTQPLGRWVGNASEVNESIESLGTPRSGRLLDVTAELCIEAARLVGRDVSREQVDAVVGSGAARERFLSWARLQGADPSWADDPVLPLAPVETPIVASADGYVARVRTRELGLLVGSLSRHGKSLDAGVALRCDVEVGDAVAAGDSIGRLYSRDDASAVAHRIEQCFSIEADRPEVAESAIFDRITVGGSL